MVAQNELVRGLRDGILGGINVASVAFWPRARAAVWPVWPPCVSVCKPDVKAGILLKERSLQLGQAIMPLVKLFARAALTKSIPLPAIQQSMCKVWGTKPETTKLILTRVDDWTEDSFNEDVYVDSRAYGKAERTRDFVLDGMKTIQKNLKDEHDLVANVRLETYEGERYFHVPPN